MLITLPSLNATEQLAKHIAGLVEPGEVIALTGDLGVGKTAFSRFFIQSLTSADTEVVSPTFTLLQTYKAPFFSLWHFDLYRLQSAKETIELGIDEAFDEGVSLIEWPEIIEEWLPEHRLSLKLTFGENEQRIAVLSGLGRWQEKLQILGRALL
jgi:tRNA threonylcarbamoyl adenosine modification protein YjeE